MPDEIDIVQEQFEAENSAMVQTVAARAAAIPVGAPGECRNCGEHSPRLVAGNCAPCRDELEV